jgi:hypothetical protein
MLGTRGKVSEGLINGMLIFTWKPLVMDWKVIKYLPRGSSRDEASLNLMKGPNKKINNLFMNFILTIFIVDKTSSIITIETRSVII